MDIWDQIESVIDNRSSKVIVEIPTKIKKPKNDINITVVIQRNGTYVTIKSHELLKKIQNYFTLSDKNIMGYFKKTNNWSLSGNKLYIPRFGSFLMERKFNCTFDNHIKLQNPLPDLVYTGSFNGNQELIFNDIMATKFNSENLVSGRAGLILNLQAGLGKTFLAMSFIGQLKCRTLIVCHNSSILNQWVKLLVEYFPGTSVGQYYGKKKTCGDLTVGIINSLVQDTIVLPGLTKDTTSVREFYDKFDLVIFDEVHEYCSETRNTIYDIAQAPYMLGLSATPSDREDSLDKINHWGCGPVYVAADVKDFTTVDIAFKGRVTKVCYSGSSDYTEQILNEKLAVTSVPLMIAQLCEDPHRLAMIVDLIIEQHRAGLNILIFADRRSYLELIRLELEKKTFGSKMMTDSGEQEAVEEELKIQALRLVGGSSAADMEIAKEKSNIILTTYQYFGTGTSIPKLNSVILTTPRKSKSRQFIGRIFRLGSNYDIERQIIDIVDVKISMKNQWQKRKEYYNEQNYTIVDRKISWKDYE